MNDRAQVVFPPGQGRGPTNPFRPFLLEDVEQSIPARFEQQVAGDPGKIAVGTANQELTYDELNQAANRLALAILELRGAQAEPVAFLLDHGCPQIVAILGILKAGKIYVPLDPSHPQARNAAVLENAQPGLLVTDNANRLNAEGLKPEACPVLNLDDLGSARNIKDPELGLAPDRPANIIYTSGSTGTVKGLVHSHRNILHTALKYTNNLHINREDRMILLYSCTFAGSVADIFSCLLNGATLLPYDLKIQGISHLGRWLAEKEISLYQSVPTVFRQFVATLSDAERFPHLRLVRLGGEAVTPSDVRLHRKVFPPSSMLAVSFAATEILGIRLYFVDQEMPISGPRVPVGYALQDTEVLILDEKGAPLPPNCVGEIAVCSPYLALGYWRDAERTQSAFRPDPDRPGVRRFCLGDLGLLRPDGCMEYLGRSDFQVKIRGHRVEVAEIEAALLTLDEVSEAVVVGKESATGGQRLEAYVVAATRPAPTASRLRISLHELLPDYMIPSAFVMLDELPTTASGKIDRLALPRADTVRPDLSNPFLPARDPLQILLVQIWQDCLNVQPIGVSDDFFELGGDSVLAMDMVLRTEEVCGRPVPEGALLSARTVEQLARLLLARETNPNSSPMIEVQKGNSSRRLFFLHGDFHGGGLYCTFLARHIGRDQAFVAVHPHGLSEPRVPTTIEEMAADRVGLIREYQPHGPYLLGGHCNGGLVAFEMAQQLVRLGERVEYLAIIAPPVNVQVGPSQPSLAPAGIFSFGVGTQPSSPAPVDLTGLSYLERRSKLLEIYYDACGQYVMKRYRGELVVVIPQGDLADYGPPQCWEAAASRGQVQFLPGEHLTIVTTSHVRALAKLMQETLAKSRLP